MFKIHDQNLVPENGIGGEGERGVIPPPAPEFFLTIKKFPAPALLSGLNGSSGRDSGGWGWGRLRAGDVGSS